MILTSCVRMCACVDPELKKNGQTNKYQTEKKTEKKKYVRFSTERERALGGVYVTVKHKRNGREHEKQNNSF